MDPVPGVTTAQDWFEDHEERLSTLEQQIKDLSELLAELLTVVYSQIDQ